MSAPGTLYFLANASMPGLVKVGHATGPIEERLRQLNTTGIPAPFTVVATFYVHDSATCERDVHDVLSKHRSNPKREFFSQAAAVLIQESIPVICKYILSTASSLSKAAIYTPSADAIYFMQYLLHDAYETNSRISTANLAEHHDKYSPLELEVLLMELEIHGYVERCNRKAGGLGAWQILPKGVKFMFDGGHQLQDLVEEARRVVR